MTLREYMMVAGEIMRAVRSIKAAERMAAPQDEEGEEGDLDPKFIDMLRTIRKNMMALAPKKTKKLGRFGIGIIRPTDTVIDLIRAVQTVIDAGA